MAHVIEPASSGRAKCRGCDERIARGELRLGERLPNPFGEGEMTRWFHLVCAAYKRPEILLEAMQATPAPLEQVDRLEAEARLGVAHRRLPRVDGAQRARSGRARCRCCRELIDAGAWRLSLVYYEEGRFQPSGFVHVRCTKDYLGTRDLIGRLKHFCPGLSEGDLEELRAELNLGAEVGEDRSPRDNDGS